MNAAVKWFQEKFASSTHKLTVAEQNRKLMHENLQMCFSLKHIEKIKDALLDMNESFDVNQRISFTLEILYRQKQLIYCQRKLKQEYYPVNEIFSLLQQTTKYYQCDAIMLHIEKFKQIYSQQRTDLAIYKRMVAKRKAFMLNEIEVVL